MSLSMTGLVYSSDWVLTRVRRCLNVLILAQQLLHKLLNSLIVRAGRRKEFMLAYVAQIKWFDNFFSPDNRNLSTA